MTEIIGTFHDVETGVVEVRPLNEEELKVYHSSIEAQNKAIEEEIARAKQKAALLSRLGITEDEARLLLG
jgi:hypothetical protein